MQALLSNIGWILSPTRKIIDRWKQGDREHRGRTLRKWSFGLFALEGTVAVVLMLFATSSPSNTLSVLSALAVIYSYSRVFEISYAFYRDPLSPTKDSDLSTSDRIRMAMRSYFGLAFNFAVLYYFLPVSTMFKDPLDGFLEAFYFSGVTLATLGYGDVLPIHWFARLLALSEVFAGIHIIAVAIATYVGGIKSEGS